MFSIKQSKGAFENSLVITDYFSRFAQAKPCKNQTAYTTAIVLYDNFFIHYSFPEKNYTVTKGEFYNQRSLKNSVSS